MTYGVRWQFGLCQSGLEDDTLVPHTGILSEPSHASQPHFTECVQETHATHETGRRRASPYFAPP